MATNIDQFVRELATFRDRKVMLKALRSAIRKPLPKVRSAIRANAVAALPHRGGLGAWAAAARINLKQKFNSRTAQVTVVGGRNSRGGESDLRALDRGRVRHPTWGHRGRTSWHTQRVPPGFFTDPVLRADEWRQAISDGVDEALDFIRRGR